jgi:hypothetical protein
MIGRGRLGLRLVDAVLRTESSDPHVLENYLVRAGRFDGHKGVPLFFDAETRELVQPLVAVAGNGDSELLSPQPRVSSQAVPSVMCSGA